MKFPSGPVVTIAAICGASLGAFLGHMYGWWGIPLTLAIAVIAGALIALL